VRATTPWASIQIYSDAPHLQSQAAAAREALGQSVGDSSLPQDMSPHALSVRFAVAELEATRICAQAQVTDELPPIAQQQCPAAVEWLGLHHRAKPQYLHQEAVLVDIYYCTPRSRGLVSAVVSEPGPRNHLITFVLRCRCSRG
jgi:hypothetical protein